MASLAVAVELLVEKRALKRVRESSPFDCSCEKESSSDLRLYNPPTSPLKPRSFKIQIQIQQDQPKLKLEPAGKAPQNSSKSKS